MSEQVWLCLCLSFRSGYEETFAFSTEAKAAEFAANDPERGHVIYSRVLDQPEIADMVMQ